MKEIAFVLDVALGQVPVLPDRGVPDHNVLKRITADDFAEFHAQARAAAETARRALEADTLQESATSWRELLGDDFPAPPAGGAGKAGSSAEMGFTPPQAVATVGRTRFA
jgi:hypothetical protein